MKAKNRALAVILSLCMILTLVPGMAFAAGDTATVAADPDIEAAILAANLGDYAQIVKDESGYTIKILKPGEDQEAAFKAVIGGILEELYKRDANKTLQVKTAGALPENCTYPDNNCMEPDMSLKLSKLAGNAGDDVNAIWAFVLSLNIHNGSGGHNNTFGSFVGESFGIKIGSGADSDETYTFKLVLADTAASAYASPDPVQPGETVSFTVSITSPLKIAAVKGDVIPGPNLTFVKAEADNPNMTVKEGREGKFLYAVASAGAKEGLKITYTYTVSQAAKAGDVLTFDVLNLEGTTGDGTQSTLSIPKTVKATATVAGSTVTPPPAGGSGAGYIPPTSSEKQNPTITGDTTQVKWQLSEDGRNLTIESLDAEKYEITDVTLNGVSKGAVNSLSGLKTGDTVVISSKMTEAYREKIRTGVENTKITLTSKPAKKGIRLDWKKAPGYKVDYYEVFRSLKKTSGFGKSAYYKTTTGSKRWYINTKQLKKGTRYYYKVRGVRALDDGTTVYTGWSTKAWRKSRITTKK